MVMPYLFCEAHGREHEADAIAAQRRNTARQGRAS